MCLDILPPTSKRAQFVDEGPDVSNFLPQLLELSQQILQGEALCMNRPGQFSCTIFFFLHVRPISNNSNYISLPGRRLKIIAANTMSWK